MKPIEYFSTVHSTAQKQYEALRMYYVENKTAKQVASKFGYTHRGFTTIVSNFRKDLKTHKPSELFFKEKKRGKKRPQQNHEAKAIIVKLRKKYYSVEDIKTTLDSKNIKMSEKTIYNILAEEGFSRLPRRLKISRRNLEPPKIEAEKSVALTFEAEEFKTASAGILSLLPYIERYGLREIIEQSDYPGTKSISKLSSILSFIALKASNIRRYTSDDRWCMDRGAGLFAGLNVLPKAAWFSSYSHRVTSEMNSGFLKLLHLKWISEGLLSDTFNLDFTTIPYWGDDEHLENNYSGKRGKALSSMLAVLAQDPDSGLIDYGDANVTHKNESSIVLEFLDFYRQAPEEKRRLRYLVFDSKFTNYENLKRLNKEGIKFITIRRRGKNIVERLNNLPGSNWKSVRVEAAGNKKRTIKVFEEYVNLKGYEEKIRQINITGHGKIKPAIIIANDFDMPIESIVRKYTKRWIVEKTISEQISFFHLNNVSSSMVIKVDFDLTMSILTHNLYRLFARDLNRYSHLSDQSIYEKFIENGADIKIGNELIEIKYKKKRNLPLILETMGRYENQRYRWLANKKIKFIGTTYS